MCIIISLKLTQIFTQTVVFYIESMETLSPRCSGFEVTLLWSHILHSSDNHIGSTCNHNQNPRTSLPFPCHHPGPHGIISHLLTGLINLKMDHVMCLLKTLQITHSPQNKSGHLHHMPPLLPLLNYFSVVLSYS